MKRVYERRREKALRAKSDFLVRRLREEWDAIEKGARHEERLRRTKESVQAVGRGLLVLLLISGVVTVMAVAPNMFAAVGKIKGRKRFAQKSVMRNAVRRLRKNRYVEMTKEKDRYTLKLTADGADVVFAQTFNNLRVQHGDVWDEQWRFVFFDIPDRHKWARDAFRQQLKLMGFYRLQESVFVYPFPCDKEVNFIADIFSISPYVRLLTTREISDDTDLQAFFAL